MNLISKILYEATFLYEIEFKELPSNDDWQPASIAAKTVFIKKINGITIKKEIDKDFYEFYEGRKKYIGFVELDIQKEFLPEIKEIKILTEYRGKGIGMFIYDFVIKQFGGCKANGQHTQFSKQIWVKLAKKYKVYHLYKGQEILCTVKNNEVYSGYDIYGNESTLICYK
jgi:hypothetical protein